MQTGHAQEMQIMAKRFWKTTGLILAGIGGLVHALQPLGLNLLNIFGGVSGIVQFLAGAVTIWIVILAFLKTNRRR